MAMVDEIMDAVRAYGVLSMRLGVDYLSETPVEQHEQFNRIRSMLAPVAPDPGLREALQTAIFNSLSITYDIAMDCDLVSCDPEAAATAVLSVLAERGMA